MPRSVQRKDRRVVDSSPLARHTRRDHYERRERHERHERRDRRDRRDYQDDEADVCSTKHRVADRGRSGASGSKGHIVSDKTVRKTTRRTSTRQETLVTPPANIRGHTNEKTVSRRQASPRSRRIDSAQASSHRIGKRGAHATRSSPNTRRHPEVVISARKRRISDEHLMSSSPAPSPARSLSESCDSVSCCSGESYDSASVEDHDASFPDFSSESSRSPTPVRRPDDAVPTEEVWFRRLSLITRVKGCGVSVAIFYPANSGNKPASSKVLHDCRIAQLLWRLIAELLYADSVWKSTFYALLCNKKYNSAVCVTSISREERGFKGPEYSKEKRATDFGCKHCTNNNIPCARLVKTEKGPTLSVASLPRPHRVDMKETCQGYYIYDTNATCNRMKLRE